MTDYRVVIQDDVFVQYRSWRWMPWRRMKDWYCDGFDIVSRKLSFRTPGEALDWIEGIDQ